MHWTGSGRRLLVAGLVVLLPCGLHAQVTTERRASILVFPRVVVGADTDTVIQLTNRSENNRHMRCYYINGAPAAASAGDSPPWRQLDFDVWLTKRQPTHWTVSRGRVADPSDETCRAGHTECDGAGYDPGTVPVPPLPFAGALLCIEVDASGFPVPGNALSGQATLRERRSGTAKYNAIGLWGFDSNNMDGVLCLGGGVRTGCPSAAEYTACPATWILNHFTEGAEDPIIGTGSSVHTMLTLLPCARDFVSQTPPSVTLQFLITNEFEEIFSASTTVTSWADIALSDINAVFGRDVLGTAYAQTRISPIFSDSGRQGFMVVARTLRASGDAVPLMAASGINLHAEGTPVEGDLITIPLGGAQ